MYERFACHCLDLQYEIHRRPDLQWSELQLHTEQQDTSCDAWKRLLDLVEQAAADGREEFAPGRELGAEDWSQIITLPPSIAKLQSVRCLTLSMNCLVRLPPEIGQMSALEEFDPYPFHRLHWFPYEITQCRNLKRSCVSTRALYGNYRYRPPFPRLPCLIPAITPSVCSVCGGPFGDSGPLQYWISLLVATDVLPLLAHACSDACVHSLPGPEDTSFSWAPGPYKGPEAFRSYIPGPHQGGLEVVQPETDEERSKRLRQLKDPY